MVACCLRSAALAFALALAVACGADRESDAGVRIEASGCALVPAIGRGAIVAETGLVLTVAHTVAGASTIEVVAADGSRHPAQLRLLDPASDIAALSVPSLAGDPLPVGDIEVPGRAHLSGREVTIVRRIAVTIEDIYLEDDVERSALEVAGEVAIGDSGGVLVADGAAVGMVYARARREPGVAFALDGTELADALERVASTPVPSGRCPP